MENKKIKKERDTMTGTIYTLRMEAEKKYKQIESIVIQRKELQQERDQLTAKCTQLIIESKEMS
jgi:uncharacterized coiled-coil DUF342 family protein